MRVHILPIVLLASLLSACGGGNGAAEGSDKGSNATPLGISYNVVEFKRQGGSKCLGDPGVKADDALCATVKFTYPEINSASKPELANTLNTVIRQQLLDTIEDAEAGQPAANAPTTLESFADDFIEEYKQDPNTFTSWEIERSIRVVHNTSKLITLLFEEFGFTGGAHPFNGSRFLVLDLENGKQVQLADLMTPGYESALNVEGEKAFRAARQLPEGSNLEEEGFTFENNTFILNNNNYGVNKDGLSFIFNSYEVAPYVMGPTEFTIPYEDIRPLIRVDGLLGSKAN